MSTNYQRPPSTTTITPLISALIIVDHHSTLTSTIFTPIVANCLENVKKQQKLLFWCPERNFGVPGEIVQQKKRLVSVSVPQAEKFVPQAEKVAPR
ncbi:hypothetical protein L195_g040565, partial [Trifolium pratense]